MLEFTLPFPPSVNSIWRNFGGKRTIKSKECRLWEMLADKQKPYNVQTIIGEVAVVYVLGRPNKRRMDIANREKCLSDTLSRWGVLKDDSQISHLTMFWDTSGEVKAGFVKIMIREL